MPENVSINRGDVVLVPFPNSDLQTTKLRPALVVQSDEIESELQQVIVAMLSSKVHRAGRASRVLLRIGSDETKETGLLSDSVIMTDNISTVLLSRVTRVIGRLRDMSSVDRALRHSLGL